MPNMLAASLLLILAASGARAQTAPPPSAPTYDVVVIRLNDGTSTGTDIDVNDGTYIASNISAKVLLEQAFDIRQDLISGLSGPIESARFDLEAKVVDPDRDALRKLTDEQHRAMLLPILKERFHLQSHIEIKTLPVYDLTVTHGGIKFARSPDQASQDANTTVHNTTLSVRNLSMDALARRLAGQVHRTVIDKTGLAGIFDLDLKWSRDDAPQTDPNAPPDIFTAVQEQLGLKLQPSRGDVPTLVVDHIDMPTPN